MFPIAWLQHRTRIVDIGFRWFANCCELPPRFDPPRYWWLFGWIAFLFPSSTPSQNQSIVLATSVKPRRSWSLMVVSFSVFLWRPIFFVGCFPWFSSCTMSGEYTVCSGRSQCASSTCHLRWQPSVLLTTHQSLLRSQYKQSPSQRKIGLLFWRRCSISLLLPSWLFFRKCLCNDMVQYCEKTQAVGFSDKFN